MPAPRSPCVLAACSGASNIGRQVSLPEVPRQQAGPQTPAEREHQRILAAYGGAYDAPHLEAVITQTVDKLVAASERPDQHYASRS